MKLAHNIPLLPFVSNISLVLSLSALLCLPAFGAETLRFLTWEDYIAEEVIADFEKKYNAKIEFVFFDHDEERDDLLVANQSGVYDLILIDGQTLSTYKHFGWIADFDEGSIPELKDFDPFWKKIRPEAAGWGVPYAWGTTGIAYRKDLVDAPITSLKQLFYPTAKLKNKIIMTPQVFELIPSALLTLGYAPDSEVSVELSQAGDLLLQQKPHIYGYEAIDVTEESALVSGEVIVAQSYNSDALMLADINDNIVYVVPEEGSNIWIDFIAIARNSRRKDLALNFLRFMAETDNARRNTEYTYAATFNKAAIALLPKEIRNDTTVFYPDFEKLFVLNTPSRRAVRKIMQTTQSLGIDK